MIDRETGPDRIVEALRKVATHLTEPAVVVLIGGCNLAVRGIKETTKDIDLVLASPAHGYGMSEPFKRAGFLPQGGYYLPGAPLDPHTMFESSDGTWIDVLLPNRLFGGLRYSDEMHSRATLWHRFGLMESRLADLSTVFLLKTVTGRWRADVARDIPDLAAIHDTGGADWRFIDAEWRRQLAAHPEPERIRTLARDAMERLSADIPRDVPWRP